MTQASDGGIVATGQAIQSSTNQQGAWLVKVDTNGCLNGDCPKALPNSVEIINEQNRFFVFPNPATSQFTVAITETAFMRDYRDLHFTCYDLAGRVMLDELLTEQATTIRRNDISSGVYLWRISDGNRSVANGKIIFK